MNDSLSRWTPLFDAVPILAIAAVYFVSRFRFGRPIRTFIRVLCAALLSAALIGVVGCLKFLGDPFNPASPRFVEIFLVVGFIGGLIFQLLLYLRRRSTERDES